MQVESDHTAEINQRERIWFFPDKFWQATKGMPADEVSKLMEEVERYAEAKDVEALKKISLRFRRRSLQRPKQRSLVSWRCVALARHLCRCVALALVCP